MSIEYNPRKYMITTFGCQANVADSGAMAGMLEALGFEKTESLGDSDLFIVNTCSVRQKSEDKAYGIGREVKILKDTGKKIPFIIMAGCMVGSVTGERQRYEFQELKKKTPWVNDYINPHQIGTLPQILLDNNLVSDWAKSKIQAEEVFPVSQTSQNAYINISTGCDNFCTFCVVPYARGREISRSREEILREIKHFILRGFKNFTLCAQNVNSWGLDMSEKFEIRSGSDKDLPFASLLREIHEFPEVEKIDFVSSNPFDFTSDLIQVFLLPKISNYLHIAVQSGSNSVLQRMNRRHTIQEFIDLIERLRTNKPDLQIGTDIIVGFPGETLEEFEETKKLFEKIKFDNAYISIYSPRKGTPAEKHYQDDISLVEKKRRHSELTKVWKESKKTIK